jgi:two-component sensor histidine kinase/CheY-like chemotaxis protein
MVDILLLEDSALDAELVREHLERAGIVHLLHRVVEREDYARSVASGYDVILADFSLPGFDGLEALRMARETVPDTPFIFVSGTLGEEVAIEALKQGATDYVVKQRLQRLPTAVRRALDEAQHRRELRRVEARQKLLVAELSHRVKNTLATVLSIARQTLRRSRSLAEFETDFVGRLHALAQTHTLLVREDWRPIELVEVVRLALTPFDQPSGSRVQIEGPAVRLEPGVALLLGMVLHELATNAARHGALQDGAGRVRVVWSMQTGDPQQVSLLWTERDGAPVSPPEGEGFGLMLIRQSVGHELGGAAILSFPPEGFTCDISFPVLGDAQVDVLPEPASADAATSGPR